MGHCYLEPVIEDLKNGLRRLEDELAKEREKKEITVDSFEGKYIINGNYQNILIIKRLSENIFDVSSPGAWKGTGLFKEGQYWGVFEYNISFILAHLAGTRGHHHGIARAENTLDVKFTNIIGQVGSGEVTWYKVSDIKR